MWVSTESGYLINYFINKELHKTWHGRCYYISVGRMADGNTGFKIWRSKMAYMMTRKTDDYMDELFNDMFGNWGIRNSSYPTVNVYEDSKAFYVEAELPGYTTEDVNIDVEKHVLHISSEKTEKKEERKYILRERGYVKFNRSFSLPEGINEDAIEAEFKNGILTVTLPKMPVEQPKKISVKIAG